MECCPSSSLRVRFVDTKDDPSQPKTVMSSDEVKILARGNAPRLTSIVLDDSLAVVTNRPIHFAPARDDGARWLVDLDPHFHQRKYGRDPEKVPKPPYEKMYFNSNDNRLAKYAERADALFSAFNEAYNSHLDLELSPDDFNLNANLNLSDFVNKNPEAMRHVFVHHQGQKSLTVVEQVSDDNDWSQFFGRMQEQLVEQVKGDLVSQLRNDFSTTGLVESSVCASAIMSTFKAYFSYGRMIPCCGIRRVHLAGYREDWVRLQAKFQQISEFFGDAGQNRLQGYYTGLRQVVDKLIDTFDGRPDVSWWNHVMDSYSGSLGSGSTRHYTGWIRKLYIQTCDRNMAESCDFELKSSEVDVSVKNYVSSSQYKVKVKSGWSGINVDDNNRVRPVMAIGVYKELASVKKL